MKHNPRFGLPSGVKSAIYDDEKGEICVVIAVPPTAIQAAKLSSTGKSKNVVNLGGGLKFQCGMLADGEGISELTLQGNVYYPKDAKFVNTTGLGGKSKKK